MNAIAIPGCRHDILGHNLNDGKVHRQTPFDTLGILVGQIFGAEAGSGCG